MKRPRVMMPARPKSTSSGVARDRKEAAIQLVRLEFDIARLERAIILASQRARTYRAELAAQSAERDKLMSLLKP